MTADERERERVRQRKLGRALTDLRNFFIEVPRDEFEKCLKFLIEMVQTVRPGAKYF